MANRSRARTRARIPLATTASGEGLHRPELAAAEILHRLHDLFARVHHERAVADDRLVEGLTAEQQQRTADAIAAFTSA